MRITDILVLFLLLSTQSCTDNGFSQPFETTVSVVDMDGKPLKGRTVKVRTGFGPPVSPFNDSISQFGKVLTSAVTDANGQAVLNYTLNALSDIAPDIAVVAAVDGDVYKCVNFVTHTVVYGNQAKMKMTGKISMDSLVTFRMRCKTNRTDVTGIQFLAYNSPFASNRTDNIERSFIREYIRTTTPQLDTVITTRVYSKAPFQVRNSMNFKNDPTFVSSGLIDFPINSTRDSILVLTF